MHPFIVLLAIIVQASLSSAESASNSTLTLSTRIFVKNSSDLQTSGSNETVSYSNYTKSENSYRAVKQNLTRTGRGRFGPDLWSNAQSLDPVSGNGGSGLQLSNLDPRLIQLVRQNPRLIQLARQQPKVAEQILRNPQLINRLLANPQLVNQVLNHPQGLASLLPQNQQNQQLNQLNQQPNFNQRTNFNQGTNFNPGNFNFDSGFPPGFINSNSNRQNQNRFSNQINQLSNSNPNLANQRLLQNQGLQQNPALFQNQIPNQFAGQFPNQFTGFPPGFIPNQIPNQLQNQIPNQFQRTRETTPELVNTGLGGVRILNGQPGSGTSNSLIPAAEMHKPNAGVVYAKEADNEDDDDEDDTDKKKPAASGSPNQVQENPYKNISIADYERFQRLGEYNQNLPERLFPPGLLSPDELAALRQHQANAESKADQKPRTLERKDIRDDDDGEDGEGEEDEEQEQPDTDPRLNAINTGVNEEVTTPGIKNRPLRPPNRITKKKLANAGVEYDDNLDYATGRPSDFQKPPETNNQNNQNQINTQYVNQNPNPNNNDPFNQFIGGGISPNFLPIGPLQRQFGLAPPRPGNQQQQQQPSQQQFQNQLFQQQPQQQFTGQLPPSNNPFRPQPSPFQQRQQQPFLFPQQFLPQQFLSGQLPLPTLPGLVAPSPIPAPRTERPTTTTPHPSLVTTVDPNIKNHNLAATEPTTKKYQENDDDDTEESRSAKRHRLTRREYVPSARMSMIQSS